MWAVASNVAPQGMTSRDPLRKCLGRCNACVMRRLTDEEREIRSSRGIPLARWWPFAAILLVALFASFDVPMLHRCAGNLAVAPGRAGALVRLALAYPCSPLLLWRSWLERLLFAALWLPVPFAVVDLLWVKRHEAYWDRIRQREKERRTEKRAQKLG